MLNNLAEAKLVEAKTSNPENYTKLGVEDINHEKAQGILFSLDGLNEVNEIIIGNNGSSGKNTQYVRRKDQQQGASSHMCIQISADRRQQQKCKKGFTQHAGRCRDQVGAQCRQKGCCQGSWNRNEQYACQEGQRRQQSAQNRLAVKQDR